MGSLAAAWSLPGPGRSPAKRRTSKRLRFARTSTSRTIYALICRKSRVVEVENVHVLLDGPHEVIYTYVARSKLIDDAIKRLASHFILTSAK